MPYWDKSIVPALKRGKTVLVAAHGNSIRGLLKNLDGISDDEIAEIEIPTAVPLVYQLDEQLKPIRSQAPRQASNFSDSTLSEAPSFPLSNSSLKRASLPIALLT